MIDRAFDCLNVSKFNKGKFGKKELAPYKDPNDWRFEVKSFCIFDGKLTVYTSILYDPVSPRLELMIYETHTFYRRSICCNSISISPNIILGRGSIP